MSYNFFEAETTLCIIKFGIQSISIITEINLCAMNKKVRASSMKDVLPNIM